MCLIITALMALGTLWFWKSHDAQNRLHSRTIFLCFGAAALMWAVDRIFAIAGGGPFFEMALDDALLGLAVAASAFVLWGAMLAKDRILGAARAS